MCNCDVCKDISIFHTHLAQIPESEREYFDSLYERILELEMDNDYYRCLVDGTWPEADRVIATRRAREKKRHG